MRRDTISFITGLFIVAATGLFFTGTAHALGELVLSPTRVIFDKHTRTASVSMVNAGNETKTYRIQFVERRMTPKGGFVEVKKAQPGELFSSKMIRFSPRQVTLQPGQAQSVRLMLRKPANLANGEYRSHMLFRAIPKANTRSVDKISGENKAIAIQLTPIIGISIPIIVRHGPVTANVTIQKLRYFKQNSQVLFEIKRDGLASVYGDLTIHFKDQAGKTRILRKVNGLAVYAPNASRRMSIPVKAPAGIKIPNGTLSIRYKQTEEAGGRLIAQQSVKIP